MESNTEFMNNNKVILTNLQRVKNWKKENPEKLALKKHRRYLWLKETSRLRSILLYILLNIYKNYLVFFILPQYFFKYVIPLNYIF